MQVEPTISEKLAHRDTERLTESSESIKALKESMQVGMESITARSRHFEITAKKGKEARTIAIEVTADEIPHMVALELEKEFTALLDYALYVKL